MYLYSEYFINIFLKKEVMASRHKHPTWTISKKSITVLHAIVLPRGSQKTRIRKKIEAARKGDKLFYTPI